MTDANTQQTDQPLVLAAQRGEDAAMQMLVARDGRWVRAVVSGLISDADAIDDVLQEVWIKAWRQIGRLRQPERWRAWLYRLARNAALDAGRRISRQGRVGAMDQPDVLAGSVPTPDQAIERHEMHQQALAAVMALPAIYREPFILRHLEGWSYKQIGETLDLPSDTVETRLLRARRLLREVLRT